MKSISCIIPIYGLFNNNNNIYFEQLLGSLSEAKRSLNSEFELIIVNDDKKNTPRREVEILCEKYNLLSILKYVENDVNKGQAYSRNKGAKSATKDYLHFIDQDDYISTNYYESFVREEKKADLYIYRPFFYIQESGETVKAYSYMLNRMYEKCSKLKDLWLLLIVNIAYSPGQVLISRKAFNEMSGFPVLKNKGSDDYGLFYNMVFSADYSAKYLKNSSFYYRTHSQQSSRNCDMSASVLEFLKSVKPTTAKSKFIHLIKERKIFSILTKLFYVTIYKRA